VTTFDVTWGSNTTGGQDKIAMVEQLDQVLDSVAVSPGGLPYNVAIVIPDGSRYPVMLEIGIGHAERSFTYWVGLGDDDAAWAFQPELAPVEGIVIDYAGQATEVWPERSRVSAQAAREAARRFVATDGRRPDNVSWDDASNDE
jgi:hypothetical protein